MKKIHNYGKTENHIRLIRSLSDNDDNDIYTHKHVESARVQFTLPRKNNNNK